MRLSRMYLKTSETAGTAYTAGFVLKRMADKTYAAGGRFHEAIAASSRPVFAAPTAARPLINPSIFVLVSCAQPNPCLTLSASATAY